MRKNNILITTAFIAAGMVVPSTASAGADPYLGDIIPYAFNFCPRGYTAANGQLLSIAQNTALFSLYGTLYGGDGRTTFGMPDLRARSTISNGRGPGLSDYRQGEKTGIERTIMTVPEMPNHAHRAGIRSVVEEPNTKLPGGSAITRQGGNAYNRSATPVSRFMNPDTIFVENTGTGLPVNNVQPYLAINYCIVTVGLYPSRN